MSVRFDAAADRLSYSAVAPPATFTITAWVYLSVDRNDFSTIGRVWTSALGTVVTWGFDSDGTSGPNYFTGGGSISNATGAVAGEWRKVAISRTGSSGRTLVATPAGATESDTGTVGTNVPGGITLGGRDTADSAEWLNGRLACVRVWDSVLTQTEVETEWNSLTPVKTSGLWANWRLATASDLTDTVNGRTLAPATPGGLTTEADPPLSAGTPVTGRATLGLGATATPAKAAVTVGRAVAGVTDTAAVRRTTGVAGTLAAPLNTTATIGRAVPVRGRLAAGVEATAAAQRSAVAVGRAPVGLCAVVAAGRSAPVLGTTTGGLSGAATPVRVAAVGGVTALGLGATVSAVRPAPVGGTLALGLAATTHIAPTLPVTGRITAGAAATVAPHKNAAVVAVANVGVIGVRTDTASRGVRGSATVAVGASLAYGHAAGVAVTAHIGAGATVTPRRVAACRGVAALGVIGRRQSLAAVPVTGCVAVGIGARVRAARAARIRAQLLAAVIARAGTRSGTATPVFVHADVPRRTGTVRAGTPHRPGAPHLGAPLVVSGTRR